jgi:glycyl-tRNA synthetase
MTNKLTIEEMNHFCKKKGFVYPNSEIYGGLSGFWDYGPLGVELKNNIKQQWWKFHVQSRDDIVGTDASIVSHQNIWKASGHVGCFTDLMLTCTKCKEKIRADTFIEEKLNIQIDGIKADEINKLVKEKKLTCPKCKSHFSDVNDFNLMFKTTVGPKTDDSAIAYLRPETAQLIFANFKLIQENARLKLPFGIAQIGKAYRNEISPRNFLFRCREFEQMEIEYFVHPDKGNDCPFIGEVLDYSLIIYSSDMQKNKEKAKEMTIKQALDKKIIKTTWHAYWLALEHKWFIDLGAKKENFRIRQHIATEKSHYALETWDLEYNFPFGYKELEGMANRTDYDLKQHIKHSKKDLSLYDEETKQKIIPHVIAEPSLGVERAMLVFLFDAYNDDKKRGNIVLKFHPKLAPIKIGVFSLVNKLNDDTKKVYNLLKEEFTSKFDSSGSVGRRYARADEEGIPYCITYDFESKDNNSITIRDRDSTKQVRVKIDILKKTLRKLLNYEIKFEDIN